jgi:hypothetical protein
MKMHLWTLFWGAFFILLGISIVLKAFGLYVPFFRIAFAVLIIFIGIRILFPGALGRCCDFKATTGRDTMFGESRIEGQEVSGDYNVVFGSNKMDLTKIEVKDQTVRIKIDVVFGGAEIKLDTSKPVRIVGSAAFGGITLPNGNAAAFGTSVYQSPSYKEGAPHILIEANSVFGGIEIK